MLDPKLQQFATKKQWERLEAWETHGSSRAAAKALGIHPSNLDMCKSAVLAKAAKQGYSPPHDMTHPVADGYRLRGTSTLYDKNGDPKIQWVKTQVDRDRQHEIFMEVVDELTRDLPRIEKIAAPRSVEDNLMSCYPVGDHHLGMLSWGEETGDDYDLTIGEELLKRASDHLIDRAPASTHAAVVFLGDFMHYDNFEAVTPTARNILDSDSRYPKMVRAAIRSMRNMIEVAARKHRYVRVIVEIGNHDLSSSIFLMECLRNIYEGNPRITVDTSPAHFHYFRHGKVLVGTHHGHGVKMQHLPLTMAADRPDDWGKSEYRYWWTGHIHQSKVQPATSAQDYSGCVVESFRILAPNDAWAAQKGYRSHRDMKMIVLHKEYGEISRLTCNPQMFHLERRSK